MYKSRNLIFVIFPIIILFLIALFNYKIDPYEIFDKSGRVAEIQNAYSMPLIYEMSKNHKYEYLAVGGSVARMFNIPCDIRNSNFCIACLRKTACTPLQQKQLTLSFLDIHPEIKNVILPLDYFSFLIKFDEDINDNHFATDITLEKWANILFSVDTTKRSFEKFVHRTKDRYSHKIQYRVFPNRIYDISSHNNFESLEHFKSLIQELKKRNLNIYVISPPYNALFLAQLYKEPDKYKAIEDIKRYIVKEVGVIYEMSYINKYTKFILTNKDNTFYPDVAHPDYVFGREFYMYLTNSDKKNVFIKKADKNNIEEILKWERKLLAQYEKDNKDYINNYLKYADERERYFNEFITITKELP